MKSENTNRSSSRIKKSPVGSKKGVFKKIPVICTKCGKKGTFTKKRCVQSRISPDESGRASYAVVRIIVRHKGSRLCRLNREHLRALRKKYPNIKDTKITTALRIHLGDNRYAQTANKMQYRLSESNKIKSKLGIKLKGMEKIEHIIRTLEGLKKAQQEGKRIRFDVDRCLKKYKMLKSFPSEVPNSPNILYTKQRMTPENAKKFNFYQP